MVVLDKCVMFFAGPSKWHDARSHCLSLGADLITFSSKEDTQLIGHVFAGIGIVIITLLRVLARPFYLINFSWKKDLFISHTILEKYFKMLIGQCACFENIWVSKRGKK